MKNGIRISIILYVFFTSCLIIPAESDFIFAKGVDEEILNQANVRISTNKKQWTKIRKNIKEDEVRLILGEPESVIEGVTTTWYYPKGGSVSFANGTIVKWSKPFNWDY